jgi:hypothetical protein
LSKYRMLASNCLRLCVCHPVSLSEILCVGHIMSAIKRTMNAKQEKERQCS